MWGLKLIDISGLIFWIYPHEVKWTQNGFGFFNLLKFCVQAKEFLNSSFFLVSQFIYKSGKKECNFKNPHSNAKEWNSAKGIRIIIKLNFIFHVCVATVNEVWKGRE